MRIPTRSKKQMASQNENEPTTDKEQRETDTTDKEQRETAPREEDEHDLNRIDIRRKASQIENELHRDVEPDSIKKSTSSRGRAYFKSHPNRFFS